MNRNATREPAQDHAADGVHSSTPRPRHGRKASLLGSLLMAATLAASTLAAGVADAAPAAGSAIAPSMVASTVPANKDVNPYGVAIVPHTMGNLMRGDVLVSNFNNGKNMAGTGSTIVQISPNGSQSVFAQINPQSLPGACGTGVGLTTALAILSRGYVIVGSLPTTDGTPATAQGGCLIVLNTQGQVISTISAPDINGPWDMTALDQGKFVTLFVSNVLNGTVAAGARGTNEGTVLRLVLHAPTRGVPQVLSNTIVGSGFAEKADPAALVLGPTGLGLGADGTLYVADTLENRIAAIPNALTRNSTAYTGRDVTAGGAIDGPLGLAIAPNGDILTANGNDGNLVETTIAGTQVLTSTINTAGAGSLFGLAVAPNGDIFFGDDSANALNKWLGSGNTTHGIATIAPQNGSQVSGVAFLVYNPSEGKVDVMMQVSGLAPNSVHPTHIHLGASCSAGGPIVYQLPNLTANAQGIAVTETTINAQHIPQSGWYINVHQGPGMDTSLGCGLVFPPM
jgi:hypothetical protein